MYANKSSIIIFNTKEKARGVLASDSKSPEIASHYRSLRKAEENTVGPPIKIRASKYLGAPAEESCLFAIYSQIFYDSAFASFRMRMQQHEKDKE